MMSVNTITAVYNQFARHTLSPPVTCTKRGGPVPSCRSPSLSSSQLVVVSPLSWDRSGPLSGRGSPIPALEWESLPAAMRLSLDLHEKQASTPLFSYAPSLTADTEIVPQFRAYPLLAKPLPIASSHRVAPPSV